jgi:hypothetical protein
VQTVTRLYESHDRATAACQALKGSGFTDDQINVVGGPGNGVADRHDARPADHEPQPANSDTQLVSKIMAAGVSQSTATGYAERVRQGAVLVTVSPPYGTGAQATAIMDQHNPVDIGSHPEDAGESRIRNTKLIDDPAPLSRLLHIPVLIKD